MIISAQIISGQDWYVSCISLLGPFCTRDSHAAYRFSTRPCAQIASVLGPGGTLKYYPSCNAFFDGSSPNKRVMVFADFGSENPIELVTAMSIPFGAAGWMALVLHTVAMEIYVCAARYQHRLGICADWIVLT